MGSPDAAERADRLGATLLILGLVREPAVSALHGLEDTPLLTVEEWEAWRSADAADLVLAHACLNAEYELRERQWNALERFGAARAAGDSLAAAVAAVDLGWHHKLPNQG